MSIDNRFGDDVFLSRDGDIVFKDNGDVMTTRDYAAKKGDEPFTGYYAVLRALSNRLMTSPGTYPFDPSYGADIQSFISNNRDANFTANIASAVENALLEDDRVRSVDSVEVSVIAEHYIVISARVRLIGSDSVSELVFPEMFVS